MHDLQVPCSRCEAQGCGAISGNLQAFSLLSSHSRLVAAVRPQGQSQQALQVLDYAVLSCTQELRPYNDVVNNVCQPHERERERFEDGVKGVQDLVVLQQ
eukprot:6124807-Heterocapsa_arctica.AAC.1